MRVTIACFTLISASVFSTFAGEDQKPVKVETDYGKVFEELVDAGVRTWTFDPNDPLLKTRRIIIFSKINHLAAKEIVTKLLFLNELDSKAPIDIYLLTPGGWRASAFAVIDIMHLIKAPVNIHALGMCQSAGCDILIAATGKRIAYEATAVVPHLNLVYDSENHTETNFFKDKVEALYKRHTTLPKEWYPLSGGRTIWLDANEALKYGLVDEVRKRKDEPADSPARQ
ncbi:MAG: ATP-dependent Clp protease proteolytic subunit [Planctomycetota bacterium]